MPATSQPLRRATRLPPRVSQALLGGGLASLALLYWFPLRRWFRRWGTTPDERTRAMPGDDVITHPTHTAMQAVTVEAVPDDIWPWLVQMGDQRGGLYSYDWLDRLFGFLGHPSANRVLPEFQHLAVGDTISLGPRQDLTVTAIDAARALVLSSNQHGIEWVWQFGLYPLDATRTRLVTRGTERISNTVGARVFMLMVEPAAFIMTRQMLLGVKRRAETLRRSRTTSPEQERAEANEEEE